MEEPAKVRDEMGETVQREPLGSATIITFSFSTGNFHVHVNNHYCNPIDMQVFLQICDKPFTAVSIMLG